MQFIFLIIVIFLVIVLIIIIVVIVFVIILFFLFFVPIIKGVAVDFVVGMVCIILDRIAAIAIVRVLNAIGVVDDFVAGFGFFSQRVLSLRERGVVAHNTIDGFGVVRQGVNLHIFFLSGF